MGKGSGNADKKTLGPLTALVVGAVLVAIPEPATTGLGLLIIASTVGVSAIGAATGKG